MLSGFHPSVLTLHLVCRGCGPTVRGDSFCSLSLYGRAAHHAVHRPDVESHPLLLQDLWYRCSDALLFPAVLGVKQAVHIECATFTGGMVAQAIIYHRVKGSVGDQLVALAFQCGFSHLLRASEYLNPSGSRLSRHCILAKHVVLLYGVSERRGATSVTETLLNDTGV